MLDTMVWHDASVERPERSCTVYVAYKISNEWQIATLAYSRVHDRFNFRDWYDPQDPVGDAFDDVAYWAYSVKVA